MIVSAALIVSLTVVIVCGFYLRLRYGPRRLFGRYQNVVTLGGIALLAICLGLLFTR